MNAKGPFYQTAMSLRGPSQEVPILWTPRTSGSQCRRHPPAQDIKRQFSTAHTHPTHARLPEPDTLRSLVQSVQEFRVQLRNAQNILARGQERSQELTNDVQKLTEEVQKIAACMDEVLRKQRELAERHHCQCRCKVGHKIDASASTTQHKRAAQSPVASSPVASISAPRKKRLVPAA